ncbi:MULTISPECIES: TraG/TraD/VirD4 family protein [Rhizobium]|uniref:TraG/TraD/VirD4 family protein n=1 Tax=Rhizobium TaxID=379 RepID=UPI001E286035|nr:MULTISPECIES: TraG/TraD/VirD4 family protein [Rhizobium]UFS85752.1 TraG/TraD/VirD4 family protein [Rhizobium sp. T136]
MESVYGKGDTASILGSCVTTRIFGLGRAEFETANWAVNAVGDCAVPSNRPPNSVRAAKPPPPSSARSS